MSFFQLLIGLLIFVSMVTRPFLYKPCVKYFPAELSAAFTSIWLVLGLIITFPFFYPLLSDNFSNIIFSPYLLLSIAKGVLLWWMIKLQQDINKDSTSSSVFWGFIALALGSLINNLFFNEGLPLLQLLCICGLGIMGFLFMFLGDAKRLSFYGKFYFILITLIGASFSVFDHLVISHIGWYPHLLFSSVCMFITCLFFGISKHDYYNIFTNKEVVIAGIVYVSSEFLIVYASVNLLPVSLVAVFMRIAAPVVMIFSALKYNEQSLKNQLIFGSIAILFVLPLIFAKN